ncbi:winged helix-turn-helix transcriptional regulator [Gordonia insulae]|uniref:Putative HTH-type transcriptional regulator n=1 Tax=Gordonia insulae TaxID=2420509 RepID=A0A3G8JM34_9ACTN|nr:helix-turn-helix domain-containing protein [Gordonia insulae]AZG45642.1 putative HTH-type transcriptional regulator [Gordonia insulae]
MALPREYPTENCPIARSLEIIGERWTLLIVRDAFYGVRRFSDFQKHLRIPKAVLSQRLSRLTEGGVLEAVPSSVGGHDEYALTDRGLDLWPVIGALSEWGGNHYQTTPQRRTFSHAECGGRLHAGVCSRCGQAPRVADVVTNPPRELLVERTDDVSAALRRPHRMLGPVTI